MEQLILQVTYRRRSLNRQPATHLFLSSGNPNHRRSARAWSWRRRLSKSTAGDASFCGCANSTHHPRKSRRKMASALAPTAVKPTASDERLAQRITRRHILPAEATSAISIVAACVDGAHCAFSTRRKRAVQRIAFHLLPRSRLSPYIQRPVLAHFKECRAFFTTHTPPVGGASNCTSHLPPTVADPKAGDASFPRLRQQNYSSPPLAQHNVTFSRFDRCQSDSRRRIRTTLIRRSAPRSLLSPPARGAELRTFSSSLRLSILLQETNSFHGSRKRTHHPNRLSNRICTVSREAGFQSYSRQRTITAF